MPTLDAIREKLRRAMPALARKYGVKAMEVFGSRVRGTPRGASDVDILVEFSRPIDLLAFLELETRVSETLGVKADLVMKEALKPRIREDVLREAVPV